MAGNIWRAFNRNPDVGKNIGELLGQLKQNRDQGDQYAALADILLPKDTQINMGDAATIPLRGGGTASLPRFVPTQEITRPRSVTDLSQQELLRLSQILKRGPASAVDLMSKVAESNRPKREIIKGSDASVGEATTPMTGASTYRELKAGIPGGTNLNMQELAIQAARGDPYAKKALELLSGMKPPTPNKKSIRQEKGDDGYWYNIVEDALTGQTTWEKTNQKWPKQEKDPLTEELKAQRLQDMKDKKEAGEKQTVEYEIFNSTVNKTIPRRITGTKQQLIKLLKSEMSNIESLVPRLSTSSGGRYTPLSRVASWPSDKIGLTTPDASWQDFLAGKVDPEALAPNLRQFATTHLGLQNKLESLQADEVLPNNQAQATSSEDQQAIQWAKQNPNDPRAKQILNLHGIK